MTSEIENKYINILKTELVPALGCTEPIALAYAGAIARKYFIGEIDSICLVVSKNIIKNVKSVTVPNTDGLKGIEAAVIAGIIAGDAEKELEVIEHIDSKQKEEIRNYLKIAKIKVEASNSKHALDIIVNLKSKEHSVKVQIIGEHTNVTLIEQDKKIILKKKYEAPQKKASYKMSVEEIYAFANSVDVKKVESTIKRQIDYNYAIALEGLKNNYGARIGQILLASKKDVDVATKAKAYAASGSDARMAGSSLPVIIVSGSGNQGITTSVPIIIYAQELKVSKEQLYRALILADLTTIHLKNGIGRLSAYCGATCAGVGAATGISTFYKNTLETVNHVIVNGLVINSGVICDGAKASCAAKIASSVEAGLLGMEMALQGSQFYKGEGIVSTNVEETIKNVSLLVEKGMKMTDEEIVELMSKKC